MKEETKDFFKSTIIRYISDYGLILMLDFIIMMAALTMAEGILPGILNGYVLEGTISVFFTILIFAVVIIGTALYVALVKLRTESRK